MIGNLITQFGADAADKEGFAALGFDLKAFVIQLITFLIVFYILKRWVFGRIVAMLEKRRTTIEEGLNLTNKLTEEKEKLDKEIAEIRKKARQEADEIIAASHHQTTAMVKEAEAAAEAKAAAILVEAQKKIEEETARARRKLEHEMVGLVAEATEVLVEEKLDAKKDAALITKALRSQN
jgi:F-type H+-transporting ATPase subunit b